MKSLIQLIVVETTGVAEPDALVFDIQEYPEYGWMGSSQLWTPMQW